MIITADNPQILKELSDQLKSEEIRVIFVTQDADKDDKGTLQDIVKFIIENPEISQDIIERIIDELRKLHNKEHIYVEKRNGERITYDEYKKMSLEERSEHIF